MDFIKIESFGNDYIVVDCKNKDVEVSPDRVKALCERNFGIGSDGFIKVSKSDVADARMQMFNSDGTIGAMCGNGALSVAKLLHHQTNGSYYSLETNAGLKLAKVASLKDKSFLFSIEMGMPKKIDEFNVGGFKADLIDVGNKHLVFFCDKISEQLLYSLYQKTKKHKQLANNVNIEIATVRNGHVLALVFEKGSNKTLSCGTGAVATAYSAVINNVVQKQIIPIEMQGGTLSITFDRQKTAFLSGKPNIVFKGTINN